MLSWICSSNYGLDSLKLAQDLMNKLKKKLNWFSMESDMFYVDHTNRFWVMSNRNVSSSTQTADNIDGALSCYIAWDVVFNDVLLQINTTIDTVFSLNYVLDRHVRDLQTLHLSQAKWFSLYLLLAEIWSILAFKEMMSGILYISLPNIYLIYNIYLLFKAYPTKVQSCKPLHSVELYVRRVFRSDTSQSSQAT